MPSIYDLHDKAFARVSAFVIARNGEKVATVALKFPANGAGRLYAYVHWIGVPMVRGFAGGDCYDKRSVAVSEALANLYASERIASMSADTQTAYTAFCDARKGMLAIALSRFDSRDWTQCLEEAGFTVWQAC